MRILVTGNLGYIGSAMCKLIRLQNVADFTEGVDNTNHRYPTYATTYIYDVADPIVADRAIAQGIDTIFHFAASAAIAESITRPSLFYQNNVGATTKLLDNLIQRGWKGNFIFSSTSSVYGNSDHMVNEDSITLPNNPYGRSKLMTEQAVKEICEAAGINCVMFRYFNVAGGWVDVGDKPGVEHILPKMCEAVSAPEGQNTFVINGDDYDTPDGTCIRDYTHPIDICRAHLHVIPYMNKNPGVHIFNLGTSKGISNLEMITAFKRFTGKELNYKIGPRRPGDPAMLVSDATKFTRETGFTYNHSSLEEIIASQWDWYSRNLRGEIPRGVDRYDV